MGFISKPKLISKDVFSFPLLLRQGLTLRPRPECSGASMAQHSHDFSSNPPTLASLVAGTTGMCHHASNFCIFCREKILPRCPG